MRSARIVAEGPKHSPGDWSTEIVDSGLRIAVESWRWLAKAREGDGRAWSRGEVWFGAPSSRGSSMGSIGLCTRPQTYSNFPVNYRRQG